MARLITPMVESLSGPSLVLAGDRSPDVVEFESAVVEFFVDAASLLGVPKSVAAIYGIIFASAQAISFADIESRLKISKGVERGGSRPQLVVAAITAPCAKRLPENFESETDAPSL